MLLGLWLNPVSNRSNRKTVSSSNSIYWSQKIGTIPKQSTLTLSAHDPSISACEVSSSRSQTVHPDYRHTLQHLVHKDTDRE